MMEVGKLWVSIGLDKSGFNRGVAEAKNEGKSLGDFLKGAFQFAVGQGMFELIRNGIKETIGLGFQFNSTMQQNLGNFKTMLGGSEQEARKLLGSLQQMAARTPFETTDLTNAAQTMMQFGISSKDVEKNLQMLGDASLGNSEKMKSLTLAFSQVQATGKLTGQDLLQMVNAGFNPLQEISEKTGMSMKDLKDAMEKGAISSDMVSKAFESATSKGGRFYKAMDEQSKTFAGQMSTIKDNLSAVFGSLTKGVFEKLSKEVLPSIIEKFDKFSAVLKTSGIQEALKTLIPAPVVSAMFSVVGFFEWIIKHGALVSTIIVSVASAFTAFKTITLLMNIATGAAGAFGAVMAFITSPIGIAVIAIGAIAGMVYILIRNWQTAGPFFKSLWETIKSAFEFGKASIWVALTAIGAAMANWYNMTLGSVIRFVSTVLGIFAKVPGVGDMFKGLQGITDKAASAMQGITNAANKSFSDAKASAGKATSDMGKNFKDLGSAGKAMAFDIGADIAGMFKGTKDKVSGMLTGVKSDSKAASSQTGVDWSNAAGSIKNAMGSATGSAKENSGALSKAADAVKDKYHAAITNLKEAVKRLVIDNKDNFAQDIINTQNAVTKQKELIDTLKKKYEELRDSKALGENADATQSAKAQMEDEITNLEKLNDRLIDLNQKREEKIQKIVEDARRKSIDKINNLNDKIVQALQKRYESEKKEEENRLKQSLKNYEENYDKQRKLAEKAFKDSISSLDDETKKKVKGLQDQIDAIDKAADEEENIKRDLEETRKIASLRDKLLNEQDSDERLKIQEQLNNAISDREERIKKEALDKTKEELRNQIETIKNSAETKKEQLEKEKDLELEKLDEKLVEFKKNYEKELEDLNIKYDKRLSTVALKQEAERLIIDGKQQEIITLLDTYGDKYENSGMTLGEKLIDGIKKGWDKLANSYITDMLRQVETFNKLKKSFEPQTAQTYQEWSNSGAKLPKYHSGGLVTKLGPKEIPAILQEGETVLPVGAGASGAQMDQNQFIDKVASKIGSAVLSAMQFGQQKPDGGGNQVVIHIDSVPLARVLIPAIKSEQDRIGNAVIQGV